MCMLFPHTERLGRAPPIKLSRGTIQSPIREHRVLYFWVVVRLVLSAHTVAQPPGVAAADQTGDHAAPCRSWVAVRACNGARVLAAVPPHMAGTT